MPDIVLKDRDGNPVIHEAITEINVLLADGTEEVFSVGGTASAKLYTPRINFSKSTAIMTIPFAATGLQASIYINGDHILDVDAPDDTDTVTVNLTDALSTRPSASISVVMSGPNFIDSDPVDIWYMPAYIEVDIGNNSLKNIGTAGTAYNAYFTDKNGSYDDGSFSGGKYIINGSGGLTIPTDFMAGTDPWTVAFAIDTYTISGNQYCRFGRGTNDVPSIFYGRAAKAIMFKLASTTMFANNAAWYDEATVKPWGDGSLSNALSVEIPTNERTVIAFRNDGEYVSLWINGEKKVTQVASKYTSSYRASTFTVGNDANNTYNMAHMVCSMLKAWNRALTDEEMTKIDN